MPERHPEELTTAEAGEPMRQVADFGRPAPLFVVTGGDPFERPAPFELVRRARAVGLSPAVSPSATAALTPGNLARLRQVGAAAISLSLDGATVAGHDSFRGYDGVFARTVAAWRAAREVGLKVQINATVTRRNLTRLPDIDRLVRAQGALLWSVFFLVPTGRGRALSALSSAEAEDVLHFLFDLGTTIAVKTTEAHHFRRVAVQRLIMAQHGADHAETLGPLYQDLRRRARQSGLIGDSRVRRPPVDVNAGRGFVFVSHTGTVRPSGFLPLDAGDVRDRPLTEIYRSAPLFAALRHPDRLGGRCGGASSALSAAVPGPARTRTGDVLAEEPWCGNEPGSSPYQSDLGRHIRTP
ncbi:radical SAM/SPASM domain-containing protein [Nonomuraea helvata]|uniref:Radical SAM/SPASM domain-containing protein n=1 Tax=Nonomuraea helvata TaxID=37484 RepID=A0ABV5RYC3_9ACTN